MKTGQKNGYNYFACVRATRVLDGNWSPHWTFWALCTVQGFKYRSTTSPIGWLVPWPGWLAVRVDVGWNGIFGTVHSRRNLVRDRYSHLIAKIFNKVPWPFVFWTLSHKYILPNEVLAELLETAFLIPVLWLVETVVTWLKMKLWEISRLTETFDGS